MKKLLLIGLLLLFACEKEEPIVEPYYSIVGEWSVWGELNYEYMTLIKGNPDSWYPRTFVWEFKENGTLFQDDSLFGGWVRDGRMLNIANSYNYEMFWLSEGELILKSR